MLEVGGFQCRLSFMDPLHPNLALKELPQHWPNAHDEYNRATCCVISEDFCLKSGPFPNFAVRLQVSRTANQVASDFDIHVFLAGKRIYPLTPSNTEGLCQWPPVLQSPTPSTFHTRRTLSPFGSLPTSSASVTRPLANDSALIQLTGDTLTNRPLFFSTDLFPSLTNPSSDNGSLATACARGDREAPSGTVEVIITARGWPPILPNVTKDRKANVATFTILYIPAATMFPELNVKPEPTSSSTIIQSHPTHFGHRPQAHGPQTATLLPPRLANLRNKNPLERREIVTKLKETAIQNLSALGGE